MKKLIFAAAVVGVASWSKAAIVNVDDFSVANSLLYPVQTRAVGVEVFAGTDNGWASSNVLGGGRGVYATLTSAIRPGLDSVEAEVFVSGSVGLFSVATSSRATSLIRLTYGSAGATGGAFNLVLLGQSQIDITFSSYDPSVSAIPTAIVATLLDGPLGNVVVSGSTVTPTVTGYVVTLSLGNFVTESPVFRGLEVSFESSYGTDFTLDQITITADETRTPPVPEPMSLMMVAAPAGVLGLKRRRTA